MPDIGKIGGYLFFDSFAETLIGWYRLVLLLVLVGR